MPTSSYSPELVENQQWTDLIYLWSAVRYFDEILKLKKKISLTLHKAYTQYFFQNINTEVETKFNRRQLKWAS